MKQYLIHGTTTDWYFAQCGPEPFAQIASSKEDAIKKIAEKFNDLVTAAIEAADIHIPAESFSMFLAGEDDENENAIIDADCETICYNDVTFLSEHDSPDGSNLDDKATTIVASITEMDTEILPDGKMETVLGRTLTVVSTDLIRAVCEAHEA